MSDKEKLLKAFDDTIWMAIRYANGRHTYAPSMVRDAIKAVQEVCPDWKPRHDATLADDRASGYAGEAGAFESDWLTDLFDESNDRNVGSDECIESMKRSIEKKEIA